MYRGAALGFSGSQHRLVHPQAVEPLAPVARQQAGVDVEDVAAEGCQRSRPQQLHISRQTDDLHLVLLQRVADRRVESPRVWMGVAAQVITGDAGVARSYQGPRL